MRSVALTVLKVLLWTIAVVCATWAVGALWFDLPWAGMRLIAASLFSLVVLIGVLWVRGSWRKLVVVFGAFILVLAWWRTIEPKGDRDWEPDVSQTAWADIRGDEVTLHHVRNCNYRSASDFDVTWETREFRLSDLYALDLAINYWGSPYMAHPIASFQFRNAPPICFTIEVRKERGEPNSLLAGLYRGYELIYIVADERDVLRLRTNYRRENVYLYRTTASPEKARAMFLEYLTALNRLREKPRWYNAVTTNCTTSIRTQRSADERAPWDWRILVNGLGDELLYERGDLATAKLSFEQLKNQARIDERAKELDQSPAFSTEIRNGRAGF